MRIETLVENTSVSKRYDAEHGLSLYIETKLHKILFDLGASALFAENAKKMNVDLSAVDIVVLSHGHYDHGGGLKVFLAVNSKAQIYLQQRAFDKHYANKPSGEKVNIGIDEGIIPNSRLIWVRDHLIIDDELQLFAGVQNGRFNPSGNQDLFMEYGPSLAQDNFAHEQNLIIKEGEKTVVFAGCAHNGIVNIIDHMYALIHCFPSHVIGGFHFYNRSRGKGEDSALIGQVGDYLKNIGSKCYTCHCTGVEAYTSLKKIMAEQIEYLATGSQLTI